MSKLKPKILNNYSNLIKEYTNNSETEYFRMYSNERIVITRKGNKIKRSMSYTKIRSNLNRNHHNNQHSEYVK